MVNGIGTDIIEIDRIEKIFKKHGNHFLQKFFTPQEQAYCLKRHHASRHLAARFAAKEAVAKALGIGFGKDLTFLTIEITHDERGKPLVSLTGAHSSKKVLLSMSHCRDFATATAILL